ncbi:flavodoxin family protein [Clostridium sp. Marseille-QA1073]
MKTLILFYSLDGLLKNLSKAMKEEINGDLLQLKNVKNNTGIYDKVPYKSFIEDNLNLETLREDIKSYELIVLAVPNWFYKLPIGLKRNTLGNIFSGKKIALFTLGKDLKIYEIKMSYFLIVIY